METIINSRDSFRSTVYLNLILLIDCLVENIWIFARSSPFWISFRIRYLLLKKSCCFFDLYIKDSIINTILVNDVSSQSHHLHTNITYLHLQGMDKFSNSSLRFKHFFLRRRKILEFLPRKGTAKFLCKFISGWHAWDIPLLDLGKIKKSNIPLLPLFFLLSFDHYNWNWFVSHWKKYKENRSFYNIIL